MDREEILRRSREEKEDEGITYVENRGRRAGIIGFCALFILIIVFNFCTGQSSYALYAIFWAYAASEGLGKYRAAKSRAHLTVVICGTVASLSFLAVYVLEVLRG